MTAPALVAAIPLVLGVLFGALANPIAWHAAVATVVSTALTAFAVRRGLGVVFVAAAAAGFWCGGACLGATAQRDATEPSILSWHARHAGVGPVRIGGVLRADAAIGPSTVSLVVDVHDVNGDAAAGGVRLSVLGALAPAAAVEWRGGRRVTVDAALHVPVDFRNPGVPSDRARLARQGIALVGTVKSAALVSVTGRGSPPAEAAASLRAWVRVKTTSGVGRWGEEPAGVVTAILIGDRSGLDPEAERKLQEAGTYHVIAISGGNIALLTGLLIALGRLARLPARGTAAASIVLLAFYGYAAGLAPSVLRATLAAAVFLAARAADHRGPALNAIAVAAAIAAVLSPLTILDPGFILSFGATVAIVTAAVRLVPSPSRRRQIASQWRRYLFSMGRAAVMLLAATVSAEIALAPVGAFLFGRISFAGLLLNFAAIPLMSIIQVAGLGALVASITSTPIASACGWIAFVATRMLLRSSSLVDIAPWLVRDVPPPAIWLMVAWYASWAALLATRRPGRRLLAAVVVAASGVLMLAGHPATRAYRVAPPERGWTRVVFLDVGQGDATLVQPAGAAPILIDAGGLPGTSFDLGRRVTLPALWAFGVTRLETLVLTHGDPDHIGGAPPILRALDPREIWDGIEVPRHEPMQALRDAASRDGVRWITRRSGDTSNAGPLRIRVLNPPEPDWERRKVRNDDSIVLEIRVGDVAILLPGDISKAVEADVARAVEPAPITIVKAPHHGSAGSSSAVLVDTLRPSCVVFSAGQRNPFGHPARSVVDRYRAAGAKVFSTAEDGAVVIDTDGKRVLVSTADGPRTSLSPRRTQSSQRGDK
jgi:competence protein ComEC